MASLKVHDLVVKEGIPTLVVRYGKGNRLREVGLESYTAYVVQDWLRESKQADHPGHPIFCQVRKEGRGEDAVYRVVNPEKHLSGVGLWKLVKWTCKEAGIESEVTAHSFRVAMVTDMLDGGAPLQHVQAVGGWTTAKMITEIYDRNTYGEPVARYRKKPLPRREADGHLVAK